MSSDSEPAARDKVRETAHILIVEDQPTTADMLSSYFEAQGYRTDAVAWGEDALTLIGEVLPDLVLLDIRLPDMDGYEICRQLRASERTKHIPIIFLTGKRRQTAKLKGLELGAIDYITKPFDIQELRLRVRNALERSAGQHLSHRITGLPTGSLVDEQLLALLGRPDWAILSVRLQGLRGFSEKYGFVAADDVLRSVALILTHIREELAPDAFVAHLDTAHLLVIPRPDEVEVVQQALRTRLGEALSFFYPYADRKRAGTDLPLGISIGVLSSARRTFESVHGVRASLKDLQEVSVADIE